MAALLGRGLQRLLRVQHQRSVQVACAHRKIHQSTSCSSDSENVKRCKGVNYMKDGSDPPLLPDSEYPDWLWKLVEPKKPLQELSQDTKEYWRRLSKMRRRQENMARKQKRF